MGWTLWICRCHLRNRFYRQVRHSPRYHQAPALPDFNKQLCSPLTIAFPRVRFSSFKRQFLGRLWNLDTSAEDTIARFARTDFQKLTFLVACTRLYNPLCPLVGWSVGHALRFFMILFLGPHCSCPRCLVSSNMAPAHPHATSVAVYPTLFIVITILPTD